MKIPTIRSLRLMFGTLLLSLTFGCSGDNASFVASTALVSITVTSPNPSTAIGTNVQFTATGTYSDTTSQDLTASVVWNSSSTTVATISNDAGTNGLAAAVAGGSTTITATLSGVSGSTTLTVSSATLLSIAVTPADLTVPGTTPPLQFTATGTYSDNTKADLTQATGLIWSSSNPLIATIANRPPPKNAGLATLVSAGTVTITATAQQGTVIGTTTLTITP